MAIVPATGRAITSGNRLAFDAPDDQPFPSRLLLGWPEGEVQLHVHVAVDVAGVVTLYRLDPARWESDFTKRKP